MPISNAVSIPDRHHRAVLAAALTALALAPARAQDRGPDGTAPGRRGSFKAVFTEPHPLGCFAEITKRLHWRRGEIEKHDPGAKHDVSRESFFVHVPENYRPGNDKPGNDKPGGGFGLLVWVSPADQGNCAADWPPVLRKSKLICVGADHSGNDRFVWYRLALALDAVHNIRKRYDIDPDRVYIAGHSGGGRLASTAAMLWPDVFRGGIYCCGVNHFRRIKKPGQTFYWPAKFARPRGRTWTLVRRRSRHVLLNGEKDVNRVHSRAVFRDLKSSHGFRHVTYLEMKGLGHVHPDATWLARCIELLDAPLVAARAKAARAKAARAKAARAKAARAKTARAKAEHDEAARDKAAHDKAAGHEKDGGESGGDEKEGERSAHGGKDHGGTSRARAHRRE